MEWLMPSGELLSDKQLFSEALFEMMKLVSPGIKDLELYEFRYGLAELVPATGWGSVKLERQDEIETRINSRAYYEGIQIKPRVGERVVLDPEIVRLSQMLFVGLVTELYSPDWVYANFYFDIRSFIFMHRTTYFTDKVLKHLGGKPYRSFEQKQKQLEGCQQVGYKAFQEANTEVDQFFIKSVQKLIAVRGIPILLAIAGATAAGKTEIVERMGAAFKKAGQKTTSIELDNFFTDRDHREAMGFNSQGKEAFHFNLFLQALDDITHRKKISTPRYNFIDGSSSHDLNGNLKPDGVPVEVEPADIIFIEGNFPFLLEEVVHLIGIKVVYLTDDSIRLKRKWRRDMDFRKKYELNYFRNRYFKEQFIMAEVAYQPQMEVCDMTVDTTGAALWTTPEIAKILDQE
jgi:uridine kinase